MHDPTRLLVAAAVLSLVVVYGALLGPAVIRSARDASQTISIAGLYLVAIIPAAAVAAGVFSASLHDRVSQVGTALLAVLIGFGVLGSLSGHGSNVRPLALAITTYALALLLSTTLQTGLDRNVTLFTGLAVVLTRASIPLPNLTLHLRWALRLVTVSSLALLVVAPGAVLFTANGRTLFGFAQLAGSTPHPNVLAPLAAFAVAVELASATRRRSLLGISAAVGCVLLAQSNAGYVGLALVVLTAVLSRPRLPPVVVGIAVLGGAATAAVYLVDPGTVHVGLDTNGLNGRTRIWQIALGVFNDHRFAGAGSQALNEEFRNGLTSRYAVLAGQAHNQVLETMAELGLLGLLLIAFFIVTALVASRQTWRRGSWLPTAGLAVLLGDFAVEAPLRSGLTGQTLLVFGVVALLLADTPRGGYPDPADSEVGHLAHVGGDRFVSHRASDPSLTSATAESRGGS